MSSYKFKTLSYSDLSFNNLTSKYFVCAVIYHLEKHPAIKVAYFEYTGTVLKLQKELPWIDPLKL
jgi:hypothetical protein